MKQILTVALILTLNFLFSQSAIVSTSLTKCVYQWIDNPIEIAIEKQACNNLIAKVDNGVLTGNGCNYIFKTDQSNRWVKITIGIKRKRSVEWVDSVSIWVKRLPDPVATFAGYSWEDTFFNKTVLLLNPCMSIPTSAKGMGWCLIEQPHIQRITSFTLSIVRNDTTIFKEKYSGFKVSSLSDTTGYDIDSYGDTIYYFHYRDISKEAYNFIERNTIAGDRIIIDNIIAVLYEKEERTLKNMCFILK